MTIQLFRTYRRFYQFMGIGATILIGICLMVYGLLSFLTLIGLLHV